MDRRRPLRTLQPRTKSRNVHCVVPESLTPERGATHLSDESAFLSGNELVAQTNDCKDELRILGILFDLLSEPGYVHIDRAR